MAADATNSPRHFFTLNEYFALEHASDRRFEYWDGEIICVSGDTLANAQIVGNISFGLFGKLAGGPCRAVGGGLAIRTPALPPYRYPNATVFCGHPKVESISGIETLLNPVLIVEVLSPTTERHDREDKFTAYQKIESFKEYLLVSQHMALITHCRRQPDDTWTSEDVAGLSALLKLESIGCTLSLAEIYEEVDFPS
jgi:Uma2 family endonuclease